ncbi:GNAT family N-acetyltransferase [Companilactobacillus furfuricola]|uniref:GNAT family N-acetyltransferase n=1 Tax=Companilactobacillus furfuricola TaxID=1462575 RepID=UPI001B886BC4|nr:N-acetyltransferase [Companilactobacillus furfuricola]
MTEKIDFTLRNETVADYSATENLTREAFWNQFAPGCAEHYLLHKIRDIDAFIPELDFVAEYNGQIIGNVIYTKSIIKTDSGKDISVLCLGPISVLPKYQGQGIGTKLIKHTQQIAYQMGYQAIFIFGDPAFYQRVGFVPAEKYQIRTSDNIFAAAHQVLPLDDGFLLDNAGRYFEDPQFSIDEKAVEKFDQKFPPKEKIVGIKSQPIFKKLVKMTKEYHS